MTAAHILLDGPRLLIAVFACMLVPLALRAVALPRLSLAAIGAGALAAISLWLSPGTIATVLVTPYALVAAIAGLYGARRAVARWTEPPQLAMAAGLVGLAGAATWLVAHRAGIALLDYPPFWVLLTAAHFHVAGTFLPIVIGWCAVGRGRAARLVAIGCLLGVPLTAAGIYLDRALELTGAIVMVTSALGAAIVIATTRGSLVLRLAAVPLAAGMVLAALYALRAHGTALVIDGLDPLSSMIVTHGVLDSLFALLALGAINTARRFATLRGPAEPDLAVVRGRQASRVRDAPPLSRLRGAWPVGATYFARTGIERADVAAAGLVDAVADLDVDRAKLAPAIADFYERTGAHELIVRPHWQRGFRAGSRLWATIARRLGQLQLPVSAESGSEGIASRIVALDAAADGRRGPRAWIRTYPDGRALYVAAYATHRDDAHAYMNIAFPLPAGQLSSVLRMVPRGAGVTVSTRLGGDCGIWLAVLGVPLRLPLSETINVWTVDDETAPAELRAWAAGYTTIARHDLWLFGIHYLTLEYAMRLRAQSR